MSLTSLRRQSTLKWSLSEQTTYEVQLVYPANVFLGPFRPFGAGSQTTEPRRTLNSP